MRRELKYAGISGSSKVSECQLFLGFLQEAWSEASHICHQNQPLRQQNILNGVEVQTQHQHLDRHLERIEPDPAEGLARMKAQPSTPPSIEAQYPPHKLQFRNKSGLSGRAVAFEDERRGRDVETESTALNSMSEAKNAKQKVVTPILKESSVSLYSSSASSNSSSSPPPLLAESSTTSQTVAPLTNSTLKGPTKLVAGKLPQKISKTQSPPALPSSKIKKVTQPQQQQQQQQRSGQLQSSQFYQQQRFEQFRAMAYRRLRVPSYTPEERLARVQRYREKRLRRNWGKKVSYSVRRALAHDRPRVHGRFSKQS